MDTPEQPTPWLTWYRSVTGDSSQLQVGIAIHKNHSYVRRNLDTPNPGCEPVLLFAHAFEENPVLALIYAGHLTPGEVLAAALALNPDASTTRDLIKVIQAATIELSKRLDNEDDSGVTPATDSTTPGGRVNSSSNDMKEHGKASGSGRGRRAEARRGLLE
ncbi:hypothetical protein [Nocardia gipuzkoensis]